MTQRCLVDTNVLIRLANSNDPYHWQAVEAVHRLRERQLAPCLTPQVIAEFWNVATRPATLNGLGWNIPDVLTYILELLENIDIFHETEQTFYLWLYLVAVHKVQGKQVHDARLVATMLAQNIPCLLTFNASDFARYADLVTVLDASER